MKVCKKDNIDLLNDILNRYADDMLYFESKNTEEKMPINYISWCWDSILHSAIWKEDAKTVDILIKCWIDINIKWEMWETPLHIAIGKENFTIIELLIKAWAKTNIKSEFLRTSIDNAKHKWDKFYKRFKQLLN